MALPATPVDGQTASLGTVIYRFDAAADVWRMSRKDVPVGTIIDWAGDANIPDGWLFCDGQPFSQAAYPNLFSVLGQAVTPDLREQFTRGSSSVATSQPFVQKQDTTRLPRAGFTAASAGAHTHTMRWNAANTDSNWAFADAVFALNDNRNPQNRHFNKDTNSAGAHTHAITGGDSETAPKHVIVAKLIKAI